MANTKGRTYAEELAGALDRSYVGKQRDVAQSSYNTNWKNIQNQYENLQQQLKQKQEQANEDYANGLVDASSNSFDRLRNYASNTANRGMAFSGINNLLKQSDIQQKGKEVAELLDTANDTTKSTAESLSKAGTSVNSELNDLASNLAQTLSNITASDISNQSSYNNALANIAEAMESRLDNNDLVNQSVADTISSAKRSASGTSDIDDKIEELYKRQGIAEILNSSDLGDAQKVAYLSGLYELSPTTARNAVDAVNSNSTAASDYETNLKNATKAAEKANNKIIGYIDPNSRTISASGSDRFSSMNPNRKTIRAKDVMTTKEQQALDKLKEQGIQYQNLYDILYK